MRASGAKGTKRRAANPDTKATDNAAADANGAAKPCKRPVQQQKPTEADKAINNSSKLEVNASAGADATVKAKKQPDSSVGGADPCSNTVPSTQAKAAPRTTGARGTKRSKAAATEVPAAAVEDADADGDTDDEAEKNAAQNASRRDAGLSRKAAQRVKSYKEAGGDEEDDGSDEKDAEQGTVEIVQPTAAASEEEVLQLTAAGGAAATSNSTVTRRLEDFELMDNAGVSEPLDRLSSVKGGLFFKGVVYPGGPSAATARKGRGGAKPQGCRVDRVGPIKEWRTRYPSKGSKDAPQIELHTALAVYTCGTAAKDYRNMYEELKLQVNLTRWVHAALCPEAGGKKDASMTAVCCIVGRQAPKIAKLYQDAEQALQLHGTFILQQLQAWDTQAAERAGGASSSAGTKGNAAADKGKGAAEDLSYADGPFARALKHAMKEDHVPIYMETLLHLEEGGAQGPIRIATDGGGVGDSGGGDLAGGAGGAGAANASIDEDEAYARRLQAEECGDYMQGGSGREGRGRGRNRGGAAARRLPERETYVQVKEGEIADDYPLPKTYAGVREEGEEEWDELLLQSDQGFYGAEDEGATRTLDQFAIYNAEGFLTTLELVPMVEGLDVDLNIYASGVIAEQEGDYWGQQNQQQEQQEQQGSDAGAGGSGSGGGSGPSGAGGSAAAGSEGGNTQRYFTTQIREWFVECGPNGQMAINIRTDVARYRLLRPHDQYAKWHKVVRRCVQMAIKVLQLLDKAGRAAQAHFEKIVKELTELPPHDPAFISKKESVVSRFLVVHGQVLLNLIRTYREQKYKSCAFANQLRRKLVERSHWELGSSSGKAGKKKGRGGDRGDQVEEDWEEEKAAENPVRARQGRKTGGRPMAMPATATTQVRDIWYSATSTGIHMAKTPAGGQRHQQLEGEKQGGASTGAYGGSGEGEAEAAPAAAAAASAGATLRVNKVVRAAKADPKTWTLEERGATDSGTDRTLYGAAVSGDLRLTPGSVIRLGSPDTEQKPVTARRGKKEDGPGKAAASPSSPSSSSAEGIENPADSVNGGDSATEEVTLEEQMEALTRGPFGLVQCIFTETAADKKGKKNGQGTSSPQIQIRRLYHGRETMLQDVAAASELFLLDLIPAPVVPACRGSTTTAVSAAASSSSSSSTPSAAVSSAAAAAAGRSEVAVLPLNGVTVAEVVEAEYLGGRSCSHTARLQNAKEDQARMQRDLERVAAGRPPVFVYRSVYCPLQGKFVECRQENLALGTFMQAPDAAPAQASLPDDSGFTKDGVTYRVGDFMYVRAAALDSLVKKEEEGEEKDEEESEAEFDSEEAPEEDEEERQGDDEAEEEEEEEEAPARKRGRKAKEVKKKTGKQVGSNRRGTHKGSNEGLRPFQVVQLLAVGQPGGKAAGALPSCIQVRRFYRPEDISPDLAYQSDFWDLYAPPGVGTEAGSSTGSKKACAPAPLSLPLSEVYGKCRVILGRPRPKRPRVDTFVVVGSYDPQQPGEKTGPPPTSIAVPGKPASAAGAAAAAAAAAKQPEATEQEGEEGSGEEGTDLRLPTLDIFAGCGGLSEGMHQAGVADTKWAIEYDCDAGDAFQLNNPDARVFKANCNVLLKAAMEKAGQLGDCVWDPACEAPAAALDAQTRADLPAPGSVGLMMGGPPCQGYSGMNRFNKSNWSQVQNSMVMAYLSYCDFYRPRYFLLENVRNFVAYNGGRVFRLVVRTLLDLGYQVRFGLLNAGHFSVAQSRRRTFIWAAQRGEVLPDWPTPQHVFLPAQLGVRMEGLGAGGGGGFGTNKKASKPHFYYVAAGPTLAAGAPLRTVTVWDAIGDLPKIFNGANEDELPYTGQPASAFQKAIRGEAGDKVRDHVVKKLNAINLERCRCIPVGVPGADWHVLEDIVAADPSRELFQGQPLVPWCLPNTADRHNGWRGLYGRLDKAGHFPTATTDPNPMGKVGQVFHPEQDRIVSVRECARAQGFPDHFRFYGNIVHRHRQVGNAVPPPLARSLGLQLREVLKSRQQLEVREAEARRQLEAQEAAARLDEMRARRKQKKQG